MAAIAIIEESRRLYLSGNTFPIKNQLKDHGAKWDADRRMWWVGIAKRSVIEALLDKATPKVEAAYSAGLKETPVLGTAAYKGRSYFVLWHGTTKRGTVAFRLSFRDGSRDFWADASEAFWKKEFRSAIPMRNLLASPPPKSGRDWPGKECPTCGSEDLDKNLHCWECGYTGHR